MIYVPRSHAGLVCTETLLRPENEEGEGREGDLNARKRRSSDILFCFCFVLSPSQVPKVFMGTTTTFFFLSFCLSN